jgi:hypothetical protein
MGFLSKIEREHPLRVAITKFKELESSGKYSGFRKMSPSWEKELYADLQDVHKKPIYRAIRANKVNPTKLGIYWAFEKEAAHAHWGDADLPLWLVTARVAKADIDWLGTVEQYMKPQYAESEVRLLKTAKPKIISVVHLTD